MDQLTKRQREVAKLLAAGLTQRQIAHILRISSRTVYDHTNNMRRRTGIESTTAIAIKAHSETR